MSLRALGNKLFGSGSNITMGEASARVQELINEHATSESNFPAPGGC